MPRGIVVAVCEELRRGISPVDHVADVLERLSGDRHNAVVALDGERALRDAAALTAELRDRGPRGPLHGLAVGVKDLIDVAGLPTRAGSAVRADAPPAARDAEVVARLRRAGAVVVAKLHTHEFGVGPTGDVSVDGPARNPRAPGRIPGGSSSGPAAAVAAGHLPLALGTDTGGSVRVPAALCGVAGLKPRHGALPSGGVCPLAPSLDCVGLVAADPAVAAAGWDALRDRGGGSPAGPLRPLTVGVPRDDYWTAVDLAGAAAVERTRAELLRSGIDVRDVDTPGVDEFPDLYMSILGPEAHAVHRSTLASRPHDYHPETAAGLADLAGVPEPDRRAARRAAVALTDRLVRHLDGIDLLLTATTRIGAPPVGARTVRVGEDLTTVGAALLELTLPANVTGWPALSVPLGDADPPASVQLTAVRCTEHDLIRIGRAAQG